MAIKIQLRQGEKINVLNVYAPNDHQENKAFWEALKTHYEIPNNVSKSDILLGNFNMIEDAIDRKSMREDPKETADALDNLKSTFKLKDGWRETYSTDLTYTFFQNSTESRSYIDRVYTNKKIMEISREWKIQLSEIPNTNYQMISLSVVSETALQVGKD